MIDILIVFVFVIALLMLQFIKAYEEVKIILNLLIVGGLFYYLTLSATSTQVSKLFLILSFVCGLLVPISIVIKYIEKITLNWKARR